MARVAMEVANAVRTEGRQLRNIQRVTFAYSTKKELCNKEFEDIRKDSISHWGASFSTRTRTAALLGKAKAHSKQ